MRSLVLPLAFLAVTASGGAALAQAATANGLVGSGFAGPMTARGGVGDQINAGRAIPYVRPLPGGLVRPTRPPRANPYGYGGYFPGHGPAFGHRPYGGGRAWVYDRPWTRYPYAPYGPF